MNRELALKIVLAVVGLLFIALGFPMVVFIRQEPALSMQFRLYVFLLLALRKSVGESQRDCLHSLVEFRSCRTHGHPGMSQHDRARRTDWRGCSCDHPRALNCARAIEAASGVSVTSGPTPFTLTGRCRTVEAAGLQIGMSFF